MMKRLMLVAVPAMLLAATSVWGQDVREAARKAEADRQAARERARLVEEKITSDRAALIAEVEKLEKRQAELEESVAYYDWKLKEDERKRQTLENLWSKKEMDYREISGNVRVVARDLETMITQSPLTALDPGRLDGVRPLLRKGYFPDIDDIAAMTDLFFDQIGRTGQVALHEAAYVGRDGETRTGTILTLGPFTSIYRDGNETGFLNYSPAGMRFFALSSLPAGGVSKNLRNYLDGKADAVTIDISGGAALRQVTHQASFIDQIRAGGPIVWPIGIIALAALFLIAWKIVFLNRVHGNTGRVTAEVNRLAESGDWSACDDCVKKFEGRNMPVVQVIKAGLEGRGEDRLTLESILQEAILREMPRVESGLSILAVFGAVAPLLGLLGTVTGMIDTFRVITLFGTGDPKLMSGGISEALVTTELGLAVAIPIMLCHTWLSRRSDKIVGEMEEKAVNLTNIIMKHRSAGGNGSGRGGSLEEVISGIGAEERDE